MIEIHLDKQPNSTRIIDLWQTPIQALRVFWGSDNAQWQHFIAHNNLQWQECNSVFEAKKQAATLIEKLAILLRTDISFFDFRLSTAIQIKGRGAVPFDAIPLASVIFDISNCISGDKNALRDFFFSFTSRSLLDFRRFDDDKFIFTYSRKAFYDDGTKLGFYTARNCYSPRENSKNPRETNFVLSGICYAIAQHFPMITFVHRYSTGIQELQSQIKASEILEHDRSSQTATAEESTVIRGSLPPESINEQLNRPASTKILSDVTNLDNFFEKGFIYYHNKETEKLNLRLQKAKEQAEEAYHYIKQQLELGQSIKESLELSKQKYRDDDTLNLASFLLTKDLLELLQKEQKIAELNEEISKKDKETVEYLEHIAKLEHTVSTLKSTLASKINDLNLCKEQAQAAMQSLAHEAEQKLNERLQAYTDKIASLEGIVHEQDTLINRLHTENTFLKDSNTELKERDVKLEHKIEYLQQENRELYAQVKNSNDTGS